MLADDLHRTLKEVEKKAGIQVVKLEDKEIRTFCELINDTNYDGINIPPGYTMNLTNRVIQKIFIEIGPLFISKIRGLIHVNSTVDLFETMPLKNKYLVTIETSEPVEKIGEKGTYYSIIFTTHVKSETGEKVYAIDNHEFFFKL